MVTDRLSQAAAMALAEAKALIEAGNKADARKLLEPWIESDLHNIPAWLLEAEACSSMLLKKKVLETCLHHNPGAAQVQKALADLDANSPATPPGRTPPQEPERTAPETPPVRRAPPQKSSQENYVLRYSLLAAILLFGLVYLATFLSDVPCQGACTRILFIGNSYTSTNNLPSVFANLARSGGHQVQAEMQAPGGWTLSAHANSPETFKILNSQKWDFVVLQEQSQTPSIESYRKDMMYPPARWLVHQIELTSTRPVFFITWARRQGWPENGLDDYEAMQLQIDRGYLIISQELNVPVVPVGAAWLLAKRQHPEINLWQSDGSHPTRAGTYLAACVFYASFFHQSPVGLAYSGYLSKEFAQALQMAADQAVLQDSRKWRLP